jgi:membrane peptidoglycan carboxypeptidase
MGRRVKRLGLAVSGALLLVVTGLPASAFVYINSLPDVRGLDPAKLTGDIVVEDRTGGQLADITGPYPSRVSVTLDQVSPKLVQATVASDDPTFWSNRGYDPVASAGRLIGRGGGSTITLRLAALTFGADSSAQGRLRQLGLAAKLESTYSKQQILDLYLNRVFYGEESYGVQAAARNFFGRDARTLDLAQAALLAGLPKAPNLYNPFEHQSLAKQRQREVLDAMRGQGYITQASAEAAAAEPLSLTGRSSIWVAPHFVRYVLSELKQLGFEPGHQQLVVRTTLDSGKQQLAEQTVRENWLANHGNDRGAPLGSSLVALDPKTGEIVAMVGSADPTGVGGIYDFASEIPINAGQIMALYAYAKVLQDRKATADTVIVDGPVPYTVDMPSGSPAWNVQEPDRRSHGSPSLEVALSSGLTIPAVKAEQALGVPTLVDFVRSLGLRPRLPRTDGTFTTNDPDTAFGPNLTLGGYLVTMLEETAALATFANGGVYHAPEAVLRVTDRSGRELYRSDPGRGSRQVFDPGISFILAGALANDANRQGPIGPGTALHLPDRQAAALSATGENGHDDVVLGFTPSLVAGLWLGGIATVRQSVGGTAETAVAPAWSRFMTGALQGMPNGWYQPPPDVTRIGDSWFLSGTTHIERLPNDPA